MIDCGIYSITNTKNGKRYIGSSKHIKRRWSEHEKTLKAGKHHSSKLQRAYNAAKDKSVFVFEILQEVDNPDKLLDIEQSYIDQYDSFNSGYNCAADTHDLRFTSKNITKAAKKKELKALYEQFWELYSPETAWIGSNMMGRIEDKHYKNRTMQEVVNMLRWFSLQNQYAGCRVFPHYKDSVLDSYLIYDVEKNIVATHLPHKNDITSMLLSYDDYSSFLDAGMIRVGDDGILEWTMQDYVGTFMKQRAFIEDHNALWRSGQLYALSDDCA